MESAPAEPTQERRRYLSQKWRRLLIVSVVLAALMGGLLLRGHLRQQRIERFVASIEARQGYCARGFSGPVENVCDHYLRAIANSLGMQREMKPSSVRQLNVGSLTDHEVAVLGDLKGLEVIFLQKARMTPEFVASVGKLKELVGLSIEDAACSDQDLKELCSALLSCPNFDTLRLGKTRITEKGLPELLRLQRLKDVALESPELNGKALRVLKGARYTRLSLNCRALRSEDLAFISEEWGGTLQSLDLASEKFSTDPGVRIKAFASLEFLSLIRIPLSEELLAAISPEVIHLALEDIELDDLCLARLVKFPWVSVCLDRVRLPKEGLKRLAVCDGVRELRLEKLECNTAELIAFFQETVQHRTEGGNSSAINHLELLDLPVTVEVIKALEVLPGLQSLTLVGDSITNQILKAVATSPVSKRLERLILGKNKITPDAWAEFERTHPNITVLEMAESE